MKVRLFKLSAVKLCGRAFIVKLNRIGSIVPVEAELMQLAMESSEERPWRSPRACDDYWSEFRHCKSLWNRFHHYYTYGTSPSCHQWKEDYHNCREWENHKSIEAKEALQRSERNRVAEQRKFKPVWELRRDPPRDWHMPLNQEKPQDS